jgi:hypothetical protein
VWISCVLWCAAARYPRDPENPSSSERVTMPPRAFTTLTFNFRSVTFVKQPPSLTEAAPPFATCDERAMS